MYQGERFRTQNICPCADFVMVSSMKYLTREYILGEERNRYSFPKIKTQRRKIKIIINRWLSLFTIFFLIHHDSRNVFPVFLLNEQS